MKQIAPNSQTLEAITKHGATSMLWVIGSPVVLDASDGRIEFAVLHWTHNQPVEDFIRAYSPLQVGDEFYIAEEFAMLPRGFVRLLHYKLDHDNYYGTEWQPASDMTAEQSRFKGKNLSVEVRRVQDLSYFEVQGLNGDYGFATKEQFYDWLKEQNIDYNSNPLVGLINFKEKE